MNQPTQTQIESWNKTQASRSPAEILSWSASTFPGRISFASSLGIEDQIITHFIAQEKLPIPVFTLDTGRLFPESYDVIAATKARYGIAMQVYFPNTAAVESLVAENGVDCYRNSIELRKACCGVRKMEPLRRALSNLDAWVCGLRREQGPTRAAVDEVAWDAGNKLVKINPLAGWTEAQMRAFVTAHNVPISPLHDKGFPSIGCACCTRAITPGEDPRAGRWWWEQPEQKECGLHMRDGKLVRIKQ